MSAADSYYLQDNRLIELDGREMTLEQYYPQLKEAEQLARRLAASRQLYDMLRAAAAAAGEGGGT